MFNVTFPQAFTIVGLFIPSLITLYKYTTYSNSPTNQIKVTNGLQTVLANLSKDIVRLSTKLEEIEKGINGIKEDIIRRDKTLKADLIEMRKEFKNDMENVKKAVTEDMGYIYSDIKELYRMLINKTQTTIKQT